jgi:acylphosphatase
MSTNRIRIRIVVHGRVHGVFFRDTCRREANARGVAGWVRNRPDGTVEAAFEGPADEVAAMATWAHHGPRHAHVVRVDSEDEPPQGETGFRIV